MWRTRPRPAFRSVLPLLAAVALAGFPLRASARSDPYADPPAAPGAPLAAGQYWWGLEEAATVNPRALRIVVSLPMQTLAVYQDGQLLALSSVSTGKPGRDTPTGEFRILEKAVEHRSSLYDDAPMPYMERITWDGVAIHAGRVPGRPASHGCIRVPLEFARRLYDITRTGVSVTVTDEDLDLPGAPDLALDGGAAGPTPVSER